MGSFWVRIRVKVFYKNIFSQSSLEKNFAENIFADITFGPLENIDL
jgi:hypothetical protein